MITSFTGENRALSNFWPTEIVFEGAEYPTVEHAYQAAKTLDPIEREQIRRARSPGKAKQLGRRVTRRPNWDEVKIEIMTRLIRQKFSDPVLAMELRATGDQELIEGNHWSDTFWGQCPVGSGFNHLGKILMKIRAELR